MRTPSSFVAGIICGVAILALAQQKPVAGANPVPNPIAVQRQAATPADARNASVQASRDDAEAVKSDINRMRALLHQMENNIAFVDTSQTPLKHQFQLEIDMWRLLLDDMEKKVRPATAH
jgi:hypothetical protein